MWGVATLQPVVHTGEVAGRHRKGGRISSTRRPGGMWGVEPRSSHAVLFRAQKCDRATSPAVITAYFSDVDSPPIRREKHRSTLVVDALNTVEWGRL